MPGLRPFGHRFGVPDVLGADQSRLVASTRNADPPVYGGPCVAWNDGVRAYRQTVTSPSAQVIAPGHECPAVNDPRASRTTILGQDEGGGGDPSPNGLPPSASRPWGVAQPGSLGPLGTTRVGLRPACTP